MKEQKNDKWLDDLISKTINTEKPQFDARKWKQKFPEEFQILQSRADKESTSFRWISILKNPIVNLAAAAAIILVVGLFLGRDGHTPEIPTTRHREVTQPETNLMSMMSMRLSYQQGGFDALDQQFRDTLDVLGPRSSSISMRDLIEGINGT